MTHPTGGIGVLDLVTPVVIALLYIALSSLFREPHRREFNAILVAGAGAAYLGGGLGGWEFGFTALATYVAYRGLRSYPWIGIAWLLHSGWDVVHHLYGNPIVPFVAKSSLGCAICDPEHRVSLSCSPNTAPVSENFVATPPGSDAKSV